MLSEGVSSALLVVEFSHVPRCVWAEHGAFGKAHSYRRHSNHLPLGLQGSELAGPSAWVSAPRPLPTAGLLQLSPPSSAAFHNQGPACLLPSLPFPLPTSLSLLSFPVAIQQLICAYGVQK